MHVCAQCFLDILFCYVCLFSGPAEEHRLRCLGGAHPECLGHTVVAGRGAAAPEASAAAEPGVDGGGVPVY